MTTFIRSMCRSAVLGALVAATGCAPAVGTTPAGGSAMPASIMEPYLAIQDALADDSTQNVKMNAGNIVTAATALGAPAVKIDQAALQLAAAAETEPPDIARVREKFGALSEALDTYMTGLKLTGGEGVRVAWCPMVNKPWMQKGDTLANPYYGKEMPTCGNFR